MADKAAMSAFMPTPASQQASKTLCEQAGVRKYMFPNIRTGCVGPIQEKHIREELRRLLPRDEGRAVEKPAEAAFRQRM